MKYAVKYAVKYVGRYIFFLMIFCGLSAPALAHNKSLSFSQFFWQGRNIEVIFSVPARDVTLLPNAKQSTAPHILAQILGQHLNKAIKLKQIAAPCQQQSLFQPLPAQAGYIRVMANYICFSNASNLTITNNAFFDSAGSHVHFARIILQADSPGGEEILFTATQREYTLSTQRDGSIRARSSFVQGFGNYFRHGVVHILSGADHLAFLMCLLLIATSRRHALVLITGFTLGHSITLALSVLSPIVPNSTLIEAMIGGSIAIVAAETILARNGLMPATGIGTALVLFALAGFSAISGGAIALSAWAGMMLFVVSYGFLINNERDNQYFAAMLTLAFGMFHGFGFGGLLLEVGLPKNQMLTGLLGFNLGVEFGQLIILIPVMIIAPYIKNLLPPIRPLIGTNWQGIAAAGLTSYGVFLFATRAIF